MPVDTNELEYIVRRILSKYPEDEHWPINIIDQVFQKIYASEFIYRKLYFRITGEDKATQQTVNQVIGKIVKDSTKLETVRENIPSQLGKKLIHTYTELGPTTDGSN